MIKELKQGIRKKESFCKNDVIFDEGFCQDAFLTYGNKYLVANGYIGYRGTLDEYDKTFCVALNIADFFDGEKGKWRETVNAPNPLFTQIWVNGKQLNPLITKPLSHKVWLNLKEGVFYRETQYCVDGITLTLNSSRFASQSDFHCLCSKITLSASRECKVQIKYGIDADVWDINGPHLQNFTYKNEKGKLTCRCFSRENNVSLLVALNSLSAGLDFSVEERGAFFQKEFTLQPDAIYTLEKCAQIFWGDETEKPCKSFSYEKKAHLAKMRELWKNSDVKIYGNDKADLSLRYNVWQLLCLAPKKEGSIAARGLSGQTYKGAVFWDTEIFLLPFYLVNNLEVAKKLVQYRVNTLPSALQKAADYGFDGAFYPWESQDGFDACSDFNVTDAETGKPVRTYFKDKQIHISADVAYAVSKYLEVSGEKPTAAYMDTLINCALFFSSRSTFDQVTQRYHLFDCLGPDEYHERVDDNAFTNYMAYHTATATVELFKRFYGNEKIVADYIRAVEKIQHFASNLYLPQPVDNVIEQFNGYFNLEDTTVEQVRSRLRHPNEYWGGQKGVATPTRVIKQADVIALLCLIDGFSAETLKSCYEFYEKYTEHGSSLSACMYALCACKIGKLNEAYGWFEKSSQIDLLGGGKQYAGGIYIGGIHPASSGGAWQIVVQGFCGLKFSNGQYVATSNLPDNIDKIVFSVCERGRRVKFTVTKHKVTKTTCNGLKEKQ